MHLDTFTGKFPYASHFVEKPSSIVVGPCPTGKGIRHLKSCPNFS